MVGKSIGISFLFCFLFVGIQHQLVAQKTISLVSNVSQKITSFGLKADENFTIK
jgi:hypothetical protein